MSQVVDTINGLAGHQGPIELANHLDLGGNRIQNLGTPVDAADALSSGHASGLYSASVLGPKLESGNSAPLKTYRAINNPNQREQLSSFLNDLMSTPPNANSIIPTITNGITVTISLPASQFRRSDGSWVNIMGRTDILSKPAQYAITSISCTGNVVTVNCVATGLVAGQVATISGVTPSSFNGTFILISSTGGGSVLGYQLDLGTATGTGGFVQVNGVYYYALPKRLNATVLLGPFSGDTAEQRLAANNDGFQIVAVVVITNNGGNVTVSGGGASPLVVSPAAGAFF